MKTLGVDTLGLGVHLLSTYNFNASSKGRSKTSVAKARLYLFSSMAKKNLSLRGHVTMTYLCACYLGF